MFERLTKAFQKLRRPVQVAPENTKEPGPVPVPEPIKPVMPAEAERPAAGRPRIYATHAEQQRAYRERKAAAEKAIKNAVKEHEPLTDSPATVAAESSKPESLLIMPAPVIEVPIPATSQQEPTARWIPEGALDALRMPGPDAIPPAQPIVETKPVIPEPMPEAEVWTPDWDEEARTDLPPRDADHIRRLIPFENESQRSARLWNDKVRHMNRSGSGSAPNQQGAIISGGRTDSRQTIWIKR